MRSLDIATRSVRVCIFVLALTPLASTQGQRPAADLLGLDSLLEIRVSTAAKYAQRLGEVASSVTIVTAEDIERYGHRTLDDVLAGLAGFYTSNDRNYTYIGARGFSRPTDYNNRLLVLIDGNTLNESVWGSAPLGGELGIPLRALERIEIVRGPGSALYGTGAIFGVINLITKTPTSLDGAEISGDAGSSGRRGGQLLFGHRFDRGLAVSLSGLIDRNGGENQYYPEYDSPETNNGVAQQLDWERRWAMLGSVASGGMRLHGRYSSRTKAFPTGAYEARFNERGAKTRDDYAFLELNYDRELGPKRRLATRTYYNWYYYDGGYPNGVDSAGFPAMLLDGGRYSAAGSEGTLRFDIASSNRLTVGGEVRRELDARYFSKLGDQPAYVELDGTATTLSAYVQDEHQLSSTVSILGGARFDRYTATVSALTPRAAMIVSPTRSTTLKLLYGEAFRAPSSYEAGANSDMYRRNPDLEPERARTLELVWQQHLGTGVLGSMSMFQYRMQGLIDLTSDSATASYVYRNVGSARSRGVEAGVDVRLAQSISGYANYTFQRTLDEAGTRLTNSPAHLFKAGAGMQLTRWLRPAAQLRYETSRRTVYDTETAPFAVTDVNIGITPPFGTRHGVSASSHQRFQLTIRLNNVFNRAYATPGGVEHRQPAIMQDGRNVRAEARYRF
jgi:outer membrane receptor for ferrienterochelin and colicins